MAVPMTTMMQAIAEAKKLERQKKKAAQASDSNSAAVASVATGKLHSLPAYTVGQEVLYWSDRKDRWVEAVVLSSISKEDGSVVYELDCKKEATPDKMRLRTNTQKNDGFQSFEAFDARKRGRSISVEREENQDYKRQPKAAEESTIEWTDAPPELLGRSSVQTTAAYVEHVIRYFIGQWDSAQQGGYSGFSNSQKGLFQDSLLQTKDDLAPLLIRLRKGEKLERGESDNDKKKRSGARAIQDGVSNGEANVLEVLEHMVTVAANREYAEAQEAYMNLTMGNKKWHDTIVVHVSANSMNGAREYRRNRDDLNTYDVDPVARKYMHAMRRMVHFAQCIRPNPDQSKNVLL
mmetsp:Transcript_5038/g.12085  ORF Transcript_5038/g.12085 Transcript_5038/m.12085 type:complete len:349 (+) Transcript_5038:102-1148(+)